MYVKNLLYFIVCDNDRLTILANNEKIVDKIAIIFSLLAISWFSVCANTLSGAKRRGFVLKYQSHGKKHPEEQHVLWSFSQDGIQFSAVTYTGHFYGGKNMWQQVELGKYGSPYFLFGNKIQATPAGYHS